MDWFPAFLPFFSPAPDTLLPAQSAPSAIERPAVIPNLRALSDSVRPRSFISQPLDAMDLRAPLLQTAVPLPMPEHSGAKKILPLGRLFGPEGPTHTDVVQGECGDCYLMATLAALAKHRPELILSSVEPVDNSDNEAIVHFRNPLTNEPDSMRVFATSYVDSSNEPIYAGQGDKTPPMDQAGWAKVLENWFAKLNEHFQLVEPEVGFKGIGQGGYVVTPFSALTGQDMYLITPKTLAEFKTVLNEVNDGKVVLLSSKERTFSEYYFPAGHAFAVLGFDGDQVELYDPWGKTVEFDVKPIFENTARLWLEVPLEPLN